MNSVKNKVYAITGLSGMGLAVAQLLYTHGAKLSLADISPSALSNALTHLSSSSSSKNDNNPKDTILTTVLDITSPTAVNAWIESTVTHFGHLDGAANLAGTISPIHGIGALIDQDDAEWDKLIATNLTGTMYCLRAEIRAIMQTAGKGSIVNASSIQGTRGFALHAGYSATKHAVVGLSRSVSKEVGPDIRVNVIAPGVIQTPLLDKAIAIQGGLAPLPSTISRVGTSEEVAQAVLFLLSDASSYTTGMVLNVDGGWDP